ncbi:EAL domain-containing protein [Haliangium sp.]|uniref:EAL domain-containing protein n=1 Tax=Haliangium sp. TaxID=2663208 RepID=UPI003D10016C
MDDRDQILWTRSHLPALPEDGVTPAISRLTPEDLRIVYQPIVSLEDGRCFAVEALVRCKHDALRSPIDLFEHAVTQMACGRLGRLIREVTFEQLSGIPVFVNVHPRELSTRWLVRPDDPICFYEHPVYLEVTESAAFEYFDLCRDVLNEVRQRTGAHVVVDDFGAGYSNLSRIVDLEPSIVKLDRSVVADLHLYPRKRVLIEHMVAMCVDLGARVVAEGIEKLDELRALRQLGVHYGQGYLLARPAYPVPAVHWPLP